MKILLVNNHHKVVGGTETYYFNLAKLLTDNGHKVAFFSTKDPKNTPTRWAKYFIEKVNFGVNDKKYLTKIKRMFFSLDSKIKIAKLLDDFKPDIVHLNNVYYYISPSILYEIKKRRIPIIQTTHDYQLITPSITFFHDGKICEITKKHKYFLAFFHRCIKGSFVASLIATTASYMQYLFGMYEKNVDLFIAPSLFMKNKLIEYGFDKNKIQHLNYFIFLRHNQSSNKPKSSRARFVLFTGRLAESKGVITLLKAAKALPQISFKFAGFYENKKIESQITEFIKSNRLQNTEILGFLNDLQLRELIYNCTFTVVPSIWYENQPYAVLEPYTLKKPVIASRIGGIPEILKNGKTGLLFNPSDTNDLINKIKKLWNNPQLADFLGKNGYKYVVRNFSSDSHYHSLLKTYQTLIRKS